MAYNKDAWRASVQNGKIPGGLLAEIEPQCYDPDLQGPAVMHPEAAWNMGRLLAAAHAQGHTSLTVKYSYRTLAKQWEKWYNYQNGGNLAAYPGTSNHGWAVAVDFTGLTTGNLQWLKANASRFGFINDVASENWHYTYQGGYPIQEDDMAYEDFKKGWKGYMQGDPEPGAEGDQRFGWNAAKAASTRPGPGSHEHAGLAKKAHDHVVTGTAE